MEKIQVEYIRQNTDTEKRIKAYQEVIKSKKDKKEEK